MKHLRPLRMACLMVAVCVTAAVASGPNDHPGRKGSLKPHASTNWPQEQDVYTYSVLYNFCSETNCADGDEPFSSLIEDASGNFYGTTSMGGANTGCSPYRCGTIFKLDSSGKYTVLYSFCALANCADGEQPYSGLFEDASGNLYGTTQYGGANLGGNVFKLDSAGHYSVRYNFCSHTDSNGNCVDGSQPLASLIEDGSGNLYGTTNRGGATNPNCPYPSSAAGPSLDSIPPATRPCSTAFARNSIAPTDFSPTQA